MTLVANTPFDAIGGAEVLLALASAWHRRCLADPMLSHAFHRGVHPLHAERLAAYWAEQLGGPKADEGMTGSYAEVIRQHSGNGPHPQMDGRAVAAFVAALDEIGVAPASELGLNLIAWFTWATALLNHGWADPSSVPDDLTLPIWGFDGTEGW